MLHIAHASQSMQEHLASLKIVHRDLACRNILIGEGKSLKITDFGLSREVEEVYEITSGKRRLPWKWMALESIQQRKFTIETDVWSYGIALWEIATLGKCVVWLEYFLHKEREGRRLAWYDCVNVFYHPPE